VRAAAAHRATQLLGWLSHAPTRFFRPISYGGRAMGPIPPNSTLIFDVELVNVGCARSGRRMRVRPAAALDGQG
jgi:hypothetical protein